MSERGVFAVDRGIFTDHRFAGAPFSEREAFLWLISEAAWKPRRVRIGAATVALDRGQLCHSIRYMAEAWGWSKSKVDRFLTRLEGWDSIRSDVGTGQTVITICNYKDYQRVSLPERDTSGTPDGTEPGHDRDKKEPIKPIETPPPPTPQGRPPARQSATPFDPDLTLNDDRIAAALSEGLPRDRVPYEWAQFRDWQLEKGSVSFDWSASWRRWCRNPLRPARDSARAQRSRQPSEPPATGQAARFEELYQQAQERSGHDPEQSPGDIITIDADDHHAGRGGGDGQDVPWQAGAGGRPTDAILRLARNGAVDHRAAAALRSRKPA